MVIILVVRNMLKPQLKAKYLEKNLDVAKILFEMVHKHLIEHSKKKPITEQEVEAVFHKLEECFPQIEALFEKVYSDCFDEVLTKIEARKDYLTRLFYAKIVADVKYLKFKHPHKKFVTPHEQPRILLYGLQKTLKTFLSTQEWSTLNNQAKDILELCANTEDTTITTDLKENKIIKTLSERVFATFLIKFKNLNIRRQECMRIMNLGLYEAYHENEQHYILNDDFFTDEHFCKVFESLFHDFFKYIEDQNGMSYLTTTYGDDSATKIKSIITVFKRYQNNVCTLI